MTDPEGYFTLRQIADELARREGTDPEETYQRCRALRQRDLFRPSHKDAGPTGTEYYPAEVLWRLRLEVPLVDLLGVNSDRLKRLDDAIRVEERDTLPNGREIVTGLRAAISGIRRDEDWILAVELLRNTETGGIRFNARLTPAWLARDPTTAEFRRDMMFLPPFELRAFLKIPATELLRPLLVKTE